MINVCFITANFCSWWYLKLEYRIYKMFRQVEMWNFVKSLLIQHPFASLCENNSLYLNSGCFGSALRLYNVYFGGSTLRITSSTGKILFKTIINDKHYNFIVHTSSFNNKLLIMVSIETYKTCYTNYQSNQYPL